MAQESGVALSWPMFDRKIYAWEMANRNKRFTQIYFDGDCPDHYIGTYSECDVVQGSPSIRLSTGEVIEI